MDLLAHGVEVERYSVDYLDSVSAQLDVSRLEEKFAPFGRNVEDQFVVSWQEKFLTWLIGEPIEERFVVFWVQIVLDCVSKADGYIRIFRNFNVFVEPVAV